RVIDVRDEATTVFAADAVARLSGVPGVAAVTAGPGLTNTITAVKNAQMAQYALMKPHVKWATRVRRVRDIVPTLRRAFALAQSGVPGPVFIEYPVDLLYPPSVVRGWYNMASGKAKTLRQTLMERYLEWHVRTLFAHADDTGETTPLPVSVPPYSPRKLQTAADWLRAAARPVLLIGSQATLDAPEIAAVQKAVAALGVP